MEAVIHKRVFARHPNCFSEEDLTAAWSDFIFAAVRIPGEREIRVGYLPDGRCVEMVGVLLSDGTWLVYHAMVPPSKKTWAEIDRERRRLS